MSKYVPPSKRNQVQPQPVKKVEAPKPKLEDEFPALVSTTKATSVKVWDKSFLKVAEEFKDKTEKEKQQKEQDRKEHLEEIKYKKLYSHLPQLTNVHKFIEPDEDEEDDYQQEENVEQQSDDEENWTVVKKKLRREKTMEEKLARPPTPEESTNWDNQEEQEEYKTYWDEKN
jgi:hypothetical protein